MDNQGFGKSSEFLNEEGAVSVDETPGSEPTSSSNEVTVPPIQPDELPPPYTPTPQGGLPMVNCKVCQAMINIEGKSHLHVVKCGVCQEATPIKAAPPGKKYVRCPCNCLLVCRSAAQRIACPRQNCRRVINLSGGVTASVTVRSPGSGRICCAYCNQIFIFQVNSRLLARCPHCRKVSEVGSGYVRTRALVCLIMGVLLLGGGIGVTIGTYEIASDYGGIYVVWTGAFISGILLIIRAMYYFSIRSSTVVGNA